MKNKIAMIGAGGHGRVCAEIAKLCGYQEIIFLDDNPSKEVNVCGVTAELPDLIDEYDIFVGIGDNKIRSSFIKKVQELGGTLSTLIHPFSCISPNVVIGCGVVIMAGVIINSGAVVSHGTIVNTSSSIDHDCKLCDCSHIGVGVHLAGAVTIGERTFVGAGTTIINNVNVCSDVIIGAGGTVIDDITEKGTYVGIPVRKIK